MLEYFIETQQHTLFLALLLPPLGISVSRVGGRPAFRRFLVGLAAGAGAAVALALLKTFTGWIVTEYWSMGFMAGVLLFGALFLLADLRLVFRRNERRAQGLLLWSALLLAAFLAAYVLRGDLVAIREFIQADESLFDVAVVYRALGWLGGLLVVALCAAGTTVAARGVTENALRPLRSALLLVYLVYGILSTVQILYAHHMIPRASWIRAVLQVSINQGDAFLYASMALTVALVVCALVAQRRSLAAARPGQATAAPEAAPTADPPTSSPSSPSQTNPALWRKARAAWRRVRRWGTVVVAGMAVTVLSLTVGVAYNERGIELSPAEPLEYVGTTVQVPLASIEDGHLHRFAHVTEAGTEVRFIIIKKNATAYGVGLDACNVCGPTGYYERDDQVVCKMCDVVMNKQTIGFPGGCNPVPLGFEVKEGVLSIELSLLEQEAGRFE
ncbi:MAG: DUF2318 domain-containing protein [Coriobacteriales bacterium]|jgi:uncharacterized membrane protein|nr:DUF2318 domain-containing protein [Coriobacteriales bacterium]